MDRKSGGRTHGNKAKTLQAIEQLGLQPGSLHYNTHRGVVLAGRLHLRDTRAAVKDVYDGFVFEGRRILALMRGELLARYKCDGAGSLRRID